MYVLQGDDDIEKSALAGQFADLVDEGLHAFNVDRIDAGDATTGDRIADRIAQVIDAARTLPMMAARRVVMVFQSENLFAPRRESEVSSRAIEQLEAFLETPEAQTTLIFVAAALDKRTRMFKLLAKHATVVECGSPEDLAGAERWVRARVAAQGIEIDPAAARLLAQLAGFPVRADPKQRHGEIGRLRREVDQVLMYALGQKKISVDDVRQVAGPAALQDDWALPNAIERGQAGDALRQLALLLDAGAPAEKILGQLGWLVRAKFPDLAPHEVKPAVGAVFRTDLDLKRSAGDPRVLLERLVVELCSGKREAAGWRR